MKKKTKIAKCWLCNSSRPKPTAIILVGCSKPGGKICKEKKVKVHFGCYMDMDA